MIAVENESQELVDSAIGPLQVRSSEAVAYDIDDYVHTTLRSQALKLQLMRYAATANKTLAKNRMPINIEGISLGGY